MRIVIFDGLCGFCDGGVRWMIARDPDARLSFAPSQSEQAAALMRARNISGAESTIFFVTDNNVFRKSAAACAIAAELAWPWNLLRFIRFIPRPLRDAGYDLIAKLRYRIAKRLDTCRIPTESEKARFLGGST